VTIYVVTLQTNAQHDAEKRADLNLFLKKMRRTFGLRCVGIEVKEQEVKAPVTRRANRTTPTADDHLGS
jgi:hypothetical protein